MNACNLCRGACCESIVVPVKFDDADANRWLGYHGTEEPNGFRFECKCEKLKNGKCTVYESRPQVCRVFEVGSRACLDAVRRRRPFKAEAIIHAIYEEAGRGEA